MTHFWSKVLITIGGLMTAFCGGCTIWYAAGLIDWWVRGRDLYMLPGFFVAMLIVGGIPTVAGILLLWVGLRQRSRKP